MGISRRHIMQTAALGLWGWASQRTAWANTEGPWPALVQAAKGQTVYFNAWGGGPAINAYIEWAAQTAKAQFGFEVKHVKITDAAEVVQRIQNELKAGRVNDGSVDLLWLNGENFHRLKQAQALFGPWVQGLPNWRYVDQQKPVKLDFSVPTDGLEAPWGTAQLTFMANRAKTPQPPTSVQAWLAHAQAHPGRLTYPQPPDFHGTTFVKQLLISLTPKPSVLQAPVTSAQFDTATAPLWAYLDRLHPHWWRKGQAFAPNIAQMHRMLADGVLDVSMTFNPNEAANLIAQGQLPATVQAFGFEGGTIGNVHFLAIPRNARASAAAQVFANFLLSPSAQARKADPQIWGDPSVLDMALLPSAERSAFAKPLPGQWSAPVPTLDEPHASWVEPLEKAWIQRYGSR